MTFKIDGEIKTFMELIKRLETIPLRCLWNPDGESVAACIEYGKKMAGRLA